jgi:hypothetical protein
MNIDTTLQERGNRHGDFKENSHLSQVVKGYMRLTPNWNDLEPHQQEALDMIAHKIGRILAGDPNFADHWHDIIGYARLVERELEQSEDSTSTLVFHKEHDLEA